MQRRHKKKCKIKEESGSVIINTKQPDNAYLVNGWVPNEVLVHIDSFLPISSVLPQTCLLLNSIFQPTHNKLALFRKLAQGVIDGDKNTVKELLKTNPWLVLFTPTKGMVIESQLTWQRFFIEENVLTIATKRKQIEMIELLLSYNDKLALTYIVNEARTKALSAWTFYEMQKNEKGEVKIVIPEAYARLAKNLIDIFNTENSSDGTLSNNTEVALISLVNRLLPKNAEKLNNFLDPELLLLAVYKAYQPDLDTLIAILDQEQQDTFCIRVIGLIQSVLAPEAGEIFCEGLNISSAKTTRLKNERSQFAQKYKLRGGESFYRSQRDSHDGVGTSLFCRNIGGRIVGVAEHDAVRC